MGVSENIIKPQALRPGDTIGVVAPAAAVERAHLERGVAALSAMGYRVKISPHALDRSGILAGEDVVRAAELTAFFADPEVKAIFAARGGYGSGRLLPLFDFAALARTPKIFLGFSDETYLLNALVAQARMVAFHGPMVAMDFSHGVSAPARDHLLRLLAGETRELTLEAPTALRPGSARGPLLGGCLSVVVAMIGTPWEPLFDGAILFLEDTGEKAYRIDRMLTQLGQAGILRRVAGIVFGAIRPVEGSAREGALIRDFIGEATAQLDCPVLSGIEAGHGTANFALPLGLPAQLDATARCLVFTEAAVTT
ncbi:MAG TPA: LD-carboxypeptidase [Candidatus Binataceae bacterium]|nr:LD-carboxypeptidase [Candidatus Binataceae bacterium]